MSAEFTLDGGYPRTGSVGAIYDELAFQRAVQAYIWATPAVGAQAVADGIAELGLSPTGTTPSGSTCRARKSSTAAGHSRRPSRCDRRRTA